MSELVEIGGYRFVLTCSRYPEQYDIEKNDVVVGYLRLRHGHLSVLTPDLKFPFFVDESGLLGDGEFENDVVRRQFFRSVTSLLDLYLPRLSVP